MPELIEYGQTIIPDMILPILSKRQYLTMQFTRLIHMKGVHWQKHLAKLSSLRSIPKFKPVFSDFALYIFQSMPCKFPCPQIWKGLNFEYLSSTLFNKISPIHPHCASPQGGSTSDGKIMKFNSFDRGSPSERTRTRKVFVVISK